MKKFLEEFKAFALRGNVVDLAIGVLIGGAFSGLVGAFTADVVQPILNIFAAADTELGWVIPLFGGSEGILIGAFITAIINFIINAFVIFLIMKAMNKLAAVGKKPEAPAAPAEPTEKDCPYCFSKIAIKATRCPHCTSVLTEDATA